MVAGKMRVCDSPFPLSVDVNCAAPEVNLNYAKVYDAPNSTVFSNRKEKSFVYFCAAAAAQNSNIKSWSFNSSSVLSTAG